MKIAIIGSGAAGLVAAEKLSKINATVIVFEQRKRIGGTWLFSDIEQDQNEIIRQNIKNGTIRNLDSSEIQSALYPSLRTNLPAKLMAFRDFEFPADTELFPKHHVVLEYLENYAKTKNLYRFIQFDSLVSKVEKQGSKWMVKVRNLMDNSTANHEFDAVVVCNGHYTFPNLPLFKNIESFKGNLRHSQTFRSCNIYRDKLVLVIGASYSALDIMREISAVAKHVYLCVRNADAGNKVPPNLKNVTQISGIKEFTESGVITMDLQSFEIESVVFATGYLYATPFLENMTDGFRHFDLYLDMIYIKDPTLAFIGLPKTIVPFHLFEYQAEFLAALFDNKLNLTDGITEQDSNRDHIFGYPYEFEYCDKLAQMIHAPLVPQWRHDLRKAVVELRAEFFEKIQGINK